MMIPDRPSSEGTGRTNAVIQLFKRLGQVKCCLSFDFSFWSDYLSCLNLADVSIFAGQIYTSSCLKMDLHVPPDHNIYRKSFVHQSKC